MSSLKDKAAKIDLSNLSQLTASIKPTPSKTAVGMHADAMFRDERISIENAQLKQQLVAFSGSIPTRLIDASLIRPSQWANRHEHSFNSATFNEFKDEIDSSKGNVQPIKVRPVPGAASEQYEIVFGHRRHRACLELGLPVLALIDESLNDSDLFVQMDRENRLRADLSPFEQGMMYKAALEKKLFPSQNALAHSIGISKSTMSVALTAASLPSDIVAAFASPLEIRSRWATSLSKALLKDHGSVLARARGIIEKADGDKASLSAGEIFNLLMGSSVSTSGEREIKVGDCTFAVVKTTGNKVSFDLIKDLFSDDAIHDIEKYLFEVAMKGNSKR